MAAFSAPFAIRSAGTPVLTWMRPYPNDIIRVGQSAELRWSASGAWLDAARLVVRYSNDGGLHWRDAGVVENNGRTWFTPIDDDISTNGLLRLETANAAAFSTDMPIQVLAPFALSELAVDQRVVHWRRANYPSLPDRVCETIIELTNAGRETAVWSAAYDAGWVASYPSNEIGRASCRERV